MKTAGIVAVLFALVLTVTANALAFQCGTRLISVGDTKAEVLQKCGSPDWQDSWQEERYEQVLYNPYAFPTRTGVTIPRVPLFTIVHVIVEAWTYNLGPTRFQRILTFENNRLVNIETGDYGY